MNKIVYFHRFLVIAIQFHPASIAWRLLRWIAFMKHFPTVRTGGSKILLPLYPGCKFFPNSSLALTEEESRICKHLATKRLKTGFFIRAILLSLVHWIISPVFLFLKFSKPVIA